MEATQALKELSSGPLRPFYLMYGDEPFLVAELLSALKERLIPPEAEAFNYHRFDAGPNQVGQAVNVAQTLPFFAPRRLVLLADCPLFSGKRQARSDAEESGEEDRGGDEAELLAAYLQRPAPHTVMVATAGESVDSRRKLTKLAMERGGVIECRPLRTDAAAAWAQDRAGRLGKKMPMEAACLLVEKVGTDLRTIQSELEKLALFAGQAPSIMAEHVMAAVAGTAEVEVWGLVDAVAEGRTGAALVHLDKMLRAGEPAPLLVWHLARHYRLLLQARALAARGITPQQAAARARQSPHYWTKLMRQARGYAREQLVGTLDRLLSADLAIKTGQDSRLVLETLLVEMSARPGD